MLPYCGFVVYDLFVFVSYCIYVSRVPIMVQFGEANESFQLMASGVDAGRSALLPASPTNRRYVFHWISIATAVYTSTLCEFLLVCQIQCLAQSCSYPCFSSSLRDDPETGNVATRADLVLIPTSLTQLYCTHCMNSYNNESRQTTDKRFGFALICRQPSLLVIQGTIRSIYCDLMRAAPR